MRYLKISISFVFCLFLVCSCKSKEEKAAEVIREHLSKTLYDFESYDPIETIVTEAYETVYNDSTAFSKALVMSLGMNEVAQAIKEAEDAVDYMRIWGAPTAYSSSYSDSKYYGYKKDYDENMNKAKIGMLAINSLGIELQDTIATLDATKVIGWEVKHKFRCKTRGGHYDIGDYRFIISPDFTKVIFVEDLDDDDYKGARKMIDQALEHTFSSDKVDSLTL